MIVAIRSPKKNDRSRVCILLVFSFALSCAGESEREVGGAESELSGQVTEPLRFLLDADSIVLERTICYGDCPAYRVRLSRDGAIHYYSSTAGEERTDRVPADSVRVLLEEIVAASRVASPPPPGDRSMCGGFTLDGPGSLAELFGAGWTRYLDSETLCHTSGVRNEKAVPVRDRDMLKNRIDSIARTGRWVRPRDRYNERTNSEL